MKKVVRLVRRAKFKESGALTIRLKRDLALLVRDFNKYGLQDQASILESLVEFHEFPYNQDFPKDMSRILEDFHQSLSEPMKGSLLEQIKLLEKVTFVRYRFMGEAHWSSVRAQASKLTEILNIRRNEVLEELRHHRSETMEGNIILLDALSELDTHMYCNNFEGRDRLVSVRGLLWDQFKTGFLTQDQDDKVRLTRTKTSLIDLHNLILSHRVHRPTSKPIHRPTVPHHLSSRWVL